MKWPYVALLRLLDSIPPFLDAVMTCGPRLWTILTTRVWEITRSEAFASHPPAQHSSGRRGHLLLSLGGDDSIDILLVQDYGP